MPTIANPDRRLKVFLCHGSEDKQLVRELYLDLREDGVDPWLDEVDLLPGQDWDLEIRRAVKQSDAILVCLSSRSVRKEGYLQKEIRFALDAADEKPEGTIFIVPVKLDECELPTRLTKWQWTTVEAANYYSAIIAALRERASSLSLTVLPGDGSDRVQYPVDSDSGRLLFKARHARDLLRRHKNREILLTDVPRAPSDTVVGVTVEAIEEIIAPFEARDRQGQEVETLLRLLGIAEPYDHWKSKNEKVHCFRNQEALAKENQVEMIPVSSSNVASIGFDPAKSVMFVEFNSGSLYEYYGVNADLFERFLEATSKGKFFHAYIRDRYHYQQLR